MRSMKEAKEKLMEKLPNLLWGKAAKEPALEHAEEELQPGMAARPLLLGVGVGLLLRLLFQLIKQRFS